MINEKKEELAKLEAELQTLEKELETLQGMKLIIIFIITHIS